MTSFTNKYWYFFGQNLKLKINNIYLTMEWKIKTATYSKGNKVKLIWLCYHAIKKKKELEAEASQGEE